MTEVAERYDISRPSVRAWIGRNERAGFASLANRSHRPHTCPHQITPTSRRSTASCGACTPTREHPSAFVASRRRAFASDSAMDNKCRTRSIYGGARQPDSANRNPPDALEHSAVDMVFVLALFRFCSSNERSARQQHRHLTAHLRRALSSENERFTR
jgi:hypothetical protein